MIEWAAWRRKGEGDGGGEMLLGWCFALWLKEERGRWLRYRHPAG